MDTITILLSSFIGSGMVIYAIAAVQAWLVYQWVKALPANPR
jgi:hypothetical protein